MIDLVHPPSLMELLQWINSLLALAVTSLQQLHNGAVYCQIVDAHEIPAAVPMRRVRWDAHRGYDTLNNYKILQAALERISFNGPVLLDRLVSGNMSSHMELLQCLGAFFRERTERIRYDPVGARYGPMPHWACSIDQKWVKSTGSPSESPEKRTLADSMLQNVESRDAHATSAVRRPRSGPPSLARSSRTQPSLAKPSLAKAAEATRQRLIDMENAALRLWCGQAIDSSNAGSRASSPSPTCAGGRVSGCSTSSQKCLSLPQSGEAKAMHRALEGARRSVSQAQSMTSAANTTDQRSDAKAASPIWQVSSSGSWAAPVKMGGPRASSQSPSRALSPLPGTNLRVPSRIPLRSSSSRPASRESSQERPASQDSTSRTFSNTRIPPPPKSTHSFAYGEFRQVVSPHSVPISQKQVPAVTTDVRRGEHQGSSVPPLLLPSSDGHLPAKTNGSSSCNEERQQISLIEALLREGAAQLAENDRRLASFAAQSDRFEAALRDAKAQLGAMAVT